MKKIYTTNDWLIVEDGFKPENHQMSESIFSIGNGRMGQRANFEEQYSGKMLRGSYVAGVFYPDKTKVGWWKNGYPEYFAKVLNAPNWIGIDVWIDGTDLDLAKIPVRNFRRTLDMKQGLLQRSFTATMPNKKEITVDTCRFVSVVDTECGAIRYSITANTDNVELSLRAYVDANVHNEDANWEHSFWEEVDRSLDTTEGVVVAKTVPQIRKEISFEVATGMRWATFLNGKQTTFPTTKEDRDKYIANTIQVSLKKGDTLTLVKYGVVLSSLNHRSEDLMALTYKQLKTVFAKGFDQLCTEHVAAWAQKWSKGDITIEGDSDAQQGIRFNIFHLDQTYSGEDARLNIGPKGFTGEKYGGSTYWDTEAFCLPFYLSTATSDVARNLLLYRHKQLPNAIANAQKLGFVDGAALYPMVTMTGEECHNEWEITFEEIHRNGAIAFAVYDYVRYTGDKSYIVDYGVDVVVAIARFWQQRATYSKLKNKYVILGVTGPNEYENNINNNWYTNLMSCWTLRYAAECLEYAKTISSTKYAEIIKRLALKETESAQWLTIANNMHLPTEDALGIFLQQDGFMDKEVMNVSELRPEDRPLNQKWSWDRILRSCFIKQADVIQGIYVFDEQYDDATIRRNFDFYEPKTVHESSLSASIHSVIASRIKEIDKAYELYLRTARLDIDDYNNEAHEGLHITSMAGTWLAIVKGFAGMRMKDDMLSFSPTIPKQWQAFSFRITWRGCALQLRITASEMSVKNFSNTAIVVLVNNKKLSIAAQSEAVEKL